MQKSANISLKDAKRIYELDQSLRHTVLSEFTDEELEIEHYVMSLKYSNERSIVEITINRVLAMTISACYDRYDNFKWKILLSTSDYMKDLFKLWLKTGSEVDLPATVSVDGLVDNTLIHYERTFKVKDGILYCGEHKLYDFWKMCPLQLSNKEIVFFDVWEHSYSARIGELKEV